MGKFIDRTGEIGYNNQGEKMTIILYRKEKDIDIQFEDGSISFNKSYSAFIRGKIKHPIRYEESFAYHIEVELGLNLDDIWNWEKNNELGINPYGIYKNTNKKIWLYCQEHNYHNYDRKGNKIGYKIRCSDFHNGKRCGYCGNHKVHYKDSLAYNYPQIAKMIAIEENNLTFEDCYNIACHSNRKFYFKCLDCNTISNKKTILSNIVNQEFCCRICSDGLSVPEKFMTNILKQLNIDFKPQLNKYIFDWCKDYKYDFYISKYNMIIEIHGKQHYIETNRGRSLKEEQANDKYKKHLAKINGIKRYYQIDCRKSELEYIKNNIIKTLNHLFDLSNIDWNLAYIESQKSKCIKAWELWNGGIYDSKKISKILNLNRSTVIDYLKKGEKCNKCNYSKNITRKIGDEKRSGKNNCNSKSIICITTKEIFNTLTEGANKYNIKSVGNITCCCKGKQKTCGKLPNGIRLVWRYLIIDHNKILRGKDISKLHD